MAPFAKGKQPTTVVKLYGVENLVVGLNLFMTAVMVSLGLWPPRESDLLRKVEADAQKRSSRGTALSPPNISSFPGSTSRTSE
jgi:hypothetical protein